MFDTFGSDKKGRTAKKVCLCFLAVGFIIPIVSILFTVSQCTSDLPEQTAQVKVVGRRIDYSRGRNSIDMKAYYIFKVSFEFPDGSKKEFQVDRIVAPSSGKGYPSSFVYDSMQLMDTGTLTYKEVENTIFLAGREFISFEKDPTPSL